MFLIGIVFFLGLNAFFVANEFASARVRETQLAPDASDSPGRAKRRASALHIVKNMDAYLSANQVGITVASLALGAMGEPFVEALAGPMLAAAGLPPAAVAATSYAVAYSAFTFAHVVLGELVPKSVAIRRPLETALATAPWMRRFAALARPVVLLFNGTANLVARKALGIDTEGSPHCAHSAEEIASIVEESGRSNEVTETEAEISKNALGLSELSVRDILVPCSQVETIDASASAEEAASVAAASAHSRFPVVDGHLDNAAGWVHVKDLLKGGAAPAKLARPLKAVPDTMQLDALLGFFSRERTLLALAVDEFGNALGLAFLDDLLERIVGDDILDEFEGEDGCGLTEIAPGRWSAEGGLALSELEDMLEGFGPLAPEPLASTLGGLVCERLGRIPACGERADLGGYIATVTSADGRRVLQVHLEKP